MTTPEVKHLTDFINETFPLRLDKVQPLASHASSRTIVRFILKDSIFKSVIGVYHTVSRENTNYISFTNTFLENSISVPEVLATSSCGKMYIVQDLGDTTLLALHLKTRNKDGSMSAVVKELYKESLQELARLQTKVELDSDLFFPRKIFDKENMGQDISRFEKSFLSKFQINLDPLKPDWEELISWLDSAPKDAFMFRDFQARNIMVHAGKAYFIDFQNGRYGFPAYDVASLLWQGSTQIIDSDKIELIAVYKKSLSHFSKDHEKVFDDYLSGFTLIRLIQTLSFEGEGGPRKDVAYVKDKSDIVINECLRVLDQLKSQNRLFPHIEEALKKVHDMKEPISSLPLTVFVESFSYKKGLPHPNPEHGGGFIFDCRFLKNPGREEQYKPLTGKDAPVQKYLEGRQEVEDFLYNVFNIVQMAVRSYKDRGFESLQVSFGCTGGQHRSIYCAERISQLLQTTEPLIQVKVSHREFPNI